MDTGAKLSPTISFHVPGEGDWLWPANDTVQRALAFGRLPDLWAALKFVPKFDVAVQAGGNMGVWPKQLAERFTTVYTFEPDPLNFRCLCENVRNERVFKFNAGLGLRNHPVGMARTDNCGAHKIAGHGAIPMLTIDDLCLWSAGVDFIQLDVEGYECRALQGADRTIAECHPVIMIEDKDYKRAAVERGEGDKAESRCSRLLKEDWGYDIAAAFTENGSTDFLYTWRGA